MDEQRFKVQIDIAIRGTLLVREIEPNLFAYKRVRNVVSVEQDGDFYLNIPIASTTEQGLVNEANLERLKDGNEFETVKLTLADPALLELCRLWGWAGTRDTYEDQYKHFGKVRTDVYDALAEIPALVENLIEIDHEGHMLFDRKGNPLPVAVHMGYINGRVSDGTYQLEKLAEVLLKRSDVVIETDRWSGVETPRTPKECIQRIPSYNAERHHSRFISFWWQPTPEDYRKVVEQAKSYGKDHPGTEIERAMFDCDILGARAAGAAYYETFSGDRRYDKAFASDED